MIMHEICSWNHLIWFQLFLWKKILRKWIIMKVRSTQFLLLMFLATRLIIANFFHNLCHLTPFVSFISSGKVSIINFSNNKASSHVSLVISWESNYPLLTFMGRTRWVILNIVIKCFKLKSCSFYVLSQFLNMKLKWTFKTQFSQTYLQNYMA